MAKAWFNHVSVFAKDLYESAEFYTELFGAKPIPTPNFGFHGQWLQLGDLQLHFYGVERPETAPQKYGHFALGVDDFEDVYRKAMARGIDDSSMWGFPLNGLPGGQLQFYVRDPSGNLIEINCADYKTLSTDIQAQIHHLSERVAQDDGNMRARLGLDERQTA